MELLGLSARQFFDQEHEAREGVRAQSYEDTCVRAVAGYYKLNLSLVYEQLRESGLEEKLSFQAFQSYFGEFPVIFGATPVRGSQSYLEPKQLFQSPTKSKLWTAYCDFHANVDANYAGNPWRALIFPMPQVSPRMVMHDTDFPPDREGTFYSFTLKTKGLRRYYIERLTSFLDALAWEP